MKFAMAVISAAALPALALASQPNAFYHHAARQASAASSAATSKASSAAPSGSSATSSASAATGSTAATSAPASGATSVATPSLLSINPTAIPLASIVANAPSASTHSITQTFAAGAAPSDISSAPPLPDLSKISPSSYPALDKPPPTDSPEVQQWINEVKNSGVQIPGFSPTIAGGCPANMNAVNDKSRCWWTCGGCTRDTDIVACPEKMSWGLTYDDGPAPYTPDLLNYLSDQKLLATFFVVGSRAISYPAMLQQEYQLGHQIAVHTWSHPSLTTLTNEEIIAEFGWTKKIIKDVLGVTPLYWRPPFGDIDDRVRAIAKAMNLTPIIWTRISATATFDTDDFNIHGGVTSAQQVLQNWDNILGNVSSINTGFIVLEHDLFQQSVEVATGYILPDALAHQPPFKIGPVTTCMNMPAGNSYLETNDNSTNPLPISASAVPTISPGAPGSAQASGVSSGSGKNGAMTTSTSGFAVVLAGLLAGASAILL
ncbi:hypothetical protein EWM64_g703 [Hericium alpestre]|uniref:chitin deacetylase n=1 Tax=Hericium alpestre TaxID=135208 RepID=A0A4Z0A9U6_9AGAM|nr:hypothetical protein EWM64_g703 [Hericium alpestre]